MEQEAVYSKQVVEMLTVANDFCVFIEDVEKYELNFVLNYLQKVFPLLYLKGSLMPGIVVSDPTTNEKYVTEEHWENIFNAMKKKIAKEDSYWFINSNLSNESAQSSLSENIADVYQDMKDFIILYQKRSVSPKENAVHECKKMFEIHWGPVISKAMKKIHEIIYKDEIQKEISDF